jgi:hypothetical protein
LAIDVPVEDRLRCHFAERGVECLEACRMISLWHGSMCLAMLRAASIFRKPVLK